ncbi:MAG: adenylate/guanylate cyclase domain-containing protein [Rhodospirillales bacterium]
MLWPAVALDDRVPPYKTRRMAVARGGLWIVGTGRAAFGERSEANQSREWRSVGGCTMQCRNCSTDNPEGNAFCQNCGQRLGIVCAACGRGCAATARFCGWCGVSLTQGQLVLEPGGERKQATVLFADIVGSTALISRLDAEEAMDKLQPVVAAMSRAVRRFDGTILRTLGDDLKAAFGAPLAREGHALLACQAALAMRDAVAGLANAPSIRVGLHSGEVVAGALDTGSSVELEAQGMTVHLASRIEQLAAPGEIYLTGECRALIGPYCETEPLGLSELRGIDGAVELFRLVGLRPAVVSEQFRVGDLAPFRGRDAELTVLKNALLAAEQGTASAIGIRAAAGLGKSRLCFEFSEWCRRRRVEVVEGRAHIFGKATPLLPVIEMLRTFLRVGQGMDAPTARERIVQRLAAVGLDLDTDLPILFDFLGVLAPDVVAPRMEPTGRLRRLREVVRAIVVAAGQRPSVVIVEDMHWMDEASGAFVETLLQAIEGTRTVLIFNFRAGWTPPSAHCPYYRELVLGELPRGESRQMVRDLLGDAPELRKIAARVAAQSDGNPFFAEQLVLSLAHGGVLAGRRGAYRLTATAPRDIALPATVEAVIGARLDALDEREKIVLQIGAIIGKEFPQVLVEEVAGATPAQASDLLGRLCDGALI